MRFDDDAEPPIWICTTHKNNYIQLGCRTTSLWEDTYGNFSQPIQTVRLENYRYTYQLFSVKV
jgi:hypothetical protein